MKGIVHFVVGVAAASCLPAVVSAGAAGDPLYFILAGASGLIPDTIDFKFSRFFYRHDVELVPDPLSPSPQEIADTIAEVMNRVSVEGNSIRLKLNTVLIGPGLWQSYNVWFDAAGHRVCVRLGDEVDTGCNRVREVDPAPAEAGLLCVPRLDYLASVNIDILDGPVFNMVAGEGRDVHVQFLPWHRLWSHSLVTALLAGLVTGVLIDIVAGVVVFVGWSLHIVLDQQGYMGSSMFYPFRRHRVEGAKKMRSVDAYPNMAAVWISCIIIFWNLYGGSGQEGLNPVGLIGWCVIMPWLIIRMVQKYKPCIFRA